jgi:hypothetical protein
MRFGDTFSDTSVTPPKVSLEKTKEGSFMRLPTKEELDYVRATISEKRPLCWWCEKRPQKGTARECGASLDWRETAAMERRQCKGFRLDFKRIGNTKDPEPWYRRPEQMAIDFNAAGDGRMF